MAGRKKDCEFPKIKSGNTWLILILVIGVLVISSLTFIQPKASETVGTASPQEASLSAEVSDTSAVTETSAPGVEEAPPTPMEIGYTDGILFFSSVLVLIVLVGTLRETIRRRGR